MLVSTALSVFSAVLCLIYEANGMATRFPTGVIVDLNAPVVRETFRNVSEYYTGPNLRVSLDNTIETVDTKNVLQYISEMCLIMNRGVLSIFGMLSLPSEAIVDEYTSRLQMPLVTINEGFANPKHQQKIRLLPDIAPALTTLFTELLNWRKAYYFYKSTEGLYRFSRMAARLQKNSVHVDLRMVKLADKPSAMNRIDALLKKASYNLDSPTKVNIILDMGAKLNCDILYEMYQKKEKKLKVHFLVGDLDTATILKWQEFVGGGMNLTILQLVDPSNTTGRTNGAGIQGYQGKLTMQAALTIDAFNVMRRGLIELQNDYPQIHQQVTLSDNFNETKGIDCDMQPPLPWAYGAEVANYFKQVEFEGLSGPVAFNEFGFRRNYVLDILSMGKKYSPQKDGYWHNGRIQNTKVAKLITNQKDTILNKTLIITTHYGPPYVFYKDGVTEDSEDVPPNDRYNGYIIEFIKEVMKELKMPYRIQLVKDEGYGNEQANQSWDGMVGELIRGEADLAIADLTITSQREEVVYFSKPFLRLGISIMIMKPEQEAENKYSFVAPLANEGYAELREMANPENRMT